MSAHPPRRLRLVVAALLLLALPACQQKMGQQPSYRPLQPSNFFEDGRSARPVVPGTIARGQLDLDDALYRGTNAKGDYVDRFPFEMTKAVLERGRQRYNIFCIVCHGPAGQGDGRIVQRGFTKPPLFLTDFSRGYKLRGTNMPLWKAPDGYYFNVITNGYGAMPSLADEIPVRDRWAIVGYVRALQYAQSADFRKAFDARKKGKKP
jgi:mono/diheme cytochrome c family protein